VVCGLPNNCTSEQLAALFTIPPAKVEIILNPNGKPRYRCRVRTHSLLVTLSVHT
jgi:hypothetical protein